jgi:single-strand DNA-binding protein
MNSLHIIGNLTKDPELRTTATGLSVCSFTVAVNRKKTKDGQQETDYFNVTAWRERGETCAKYLSKGKKVSVVGPVSVRTWDSNGKHGASLDVTAEEVEFLSPKSEVQPAQPEPPVDQQTGFQQVDTDELPF